MTAMRSGIPTDILEQRAAEQRRELHNSVSELRFALRERMNLRRQARQFLLPAAAVAGMFGLAFGYIVTGVFVD